MIFTSIVQILFLVIVRFYRGKISAIYNLYDSGGGGGGQFLILVWVQFSLAFSVTFSPICNAKELTNHVSLNPDFCWRKPKQLSENYISSNRDLQKIQVMAVFA